ncbi:hypothetical protein [Altererythrobacter sp. C41]|uniref:hypothetical protein n=1 Tax=Altererythrobacter sp. C41 TaxID=2806021 RepID=UPI00193375AE|nr:hypothetical protein [Altererythrobacter sp. C41]MBM0168869.1 hypothetical protein [Altererythrobacter sp. C41]
MYRHFAVVTVCLTGALAILADGENREAVADELARRDRQAELKRAEAEKFGAPKLVTSSDQRGGHAATFDYGGTPSTFGAPMDTAGAGAESASYLPRNSTTRVGTGIDYAALGLTEEEFERLSPSEREALLREFRQLRSRQARSLLEGSLARGGGSSLDY